MKRVPGGPLELNAGGRLKIDHPALTIEIKTGEAGVEKLLANYQRCMRELQDLLELLEVKSPKEAGRLFDDYRRQQDYVQKEQERLDDILEGESIGHLKKVLEKIPKASEPQRPAVAIAQEHGKAQSKLEALSDAIEEKTELIRDWQWKYESLEELQNSMLEEKGSIRALEKDLQEQLKLPAGIKDKDEFLNNYRQRKEELEGVKDALPSLRVEKARWEAKAPDETFEQLQSQLAEAETEFRQRMAEGEALLAILDALERTEAQLAGMTLEPLVKEMGRLFPLLTAFNYESALVDEDSLGTAVRTGGLHVPYQLLSLGTKAGMGLAIRLAMASHFLKDLGGFLVMDDPLVDMDPERQKAACEVLKQFASRNQTIVVTCHPGHAKLLGGNQISLC